MKILREPGMEKKIELLREKEFKIQYKNSTFYVLCRIQKSPNGVFLAACTVINFIP